MKFGKRLQSQIEDTLPEWRNKFLCYKQLKKRLKGLAAPEGFNSAAFSEHSAAHTGAVGCDPSRKQQEHCNGTASVVNAAVQRTLLGGATEVDRPCGPVTAEEEEFVRILNEELEKFNDFFIEKEEEYVIRLQDLKERVEGLRKMCADTPIPKCLSCADEVNEARRAIVAFHGEMVLLENYSSLNYTGLVKILKKHDKRTGLLLRMPYINNVLRQPFYTTELLSKLVRECEEKLLVVFDFPAAGEDPAALKNGTGSGSALSALDIPAAAPAPSCTGASTPPSIPAPACCPPKEREPAGTAAGSCGAVDLLPQLPKTEAVDYIYRSTLAALRSLQEMRGGGTQGAAAAAASAEADEKFRESLSSPLGEEDSDSDSDGKQENAGEGGRPAKRAKKECSAVAPGNGRKGSSCNGSSGDKKACC